ncbi:NAD(P)-binding protein [Aureobasidium subglaciale]|nr:NAD(P)-binding protein [Aureobasidium subglaciale]
MAYLSTMRTSVLRAARLTKVQSSVAPISVRTFASTRILSDEQSINVVSYSKTGQREQETLAVPAPGNEPVSPPGQDIEVAAQPLKADLLAKMPPTLQKFTLTDKVAVITGGGRGLGYNMAQALSEVGVKGIAIFDVQQELGEKSAQQLSAQTGVDVRFYKVDVRDQAAIQQAVQDVAAHYGHIDVLISAAGIADSNVKAETYDSEKFRRLLDINITGTFLVAQAVGQQMIKLKTGGSIINIASMSGTIVNYPQEQSCYNASKAAVIQLSKSLAAEWARFDIRVNSISPGYMDTALNRVPALDAQKRIWMDNTPQKRLGAVDDLNNLAVYLASPGSSYMTGNNCLIDGGYTLW